MGNFSKYLDKAINEDKESVNKKSAYTLPKVEIIPNSEADDVYPGNTHFELKLYTNDKQSHSHIFTKDDMLKLSKKLSDWASKNTN